MSTSVEASASTSADGAIWLISGISVASAADAGRADRGDIDEVATAHAVSGCRYVRSISARIFAMVDLALLSDARDPEWTAGRIRSQCYRVDPPTPGPSRADEPGAGLDRLGAPDRREKPACQPLFGRLSRGSVRRPQSQA